MTRITFLLSGIALVAASAGHAQLLGGGGGIGGMVGGIGGTTGNLGGNVAAAMGQVDGDVQRSLRSQQLRDQSHADRIRAHEARTAAKAAQRYPALALPTGSAMGQPVASVTAGAASPPLAANASGMVSGQRPAAAVDGVGGRSFAARADAEAGQRGLRRVAHSVSGVAVYVPVVAVAAPRAVYGGGGGTYVYGGAFYDGGYYGGAAAPVPVEDRQYRELQRDTAGTGVTVERRGADLVMELPADVTFAFDRADIQPRFVPALDAVARTIAAYPATDVEVIGHTDAVGSDAYNLALSQRRGASVADFLVSRHTDAERLVVEGLGKTEPVASNATVAGRAANRRVEIVLHGQPA